MISRAATPARGAALAAAGTAALAASLCAQAPAASQVPGPQLALSVPLGSNGKPIATAGTEACVTSVVQAQRSATFVGEMTALPGTTRMQMRIEVLERGPKEARFRTVAYPGLGQWLRSSPGVKTYRNLSKVTDLSPATYRAAVRYRWIGAHGRTLRTLTLRTPRCEQPAAATQSPGNEPHNPA